MCNEHVLDDYRLPLVFSSRNLQTSFYKSIKSVEKEETESFSNLNVDDDDGDDGKG